MTESGSAAPARRKSCAQCIKSKRRCDLQRPRCLRCSKHNIDCDYGPAQQVVRKRTADDAGLSSPADFDSPGTIDLGAELDLQCFTRQADSVDTLDLPRDVEEFLRSIMASPDVEKANLAIARPASLMMEPVTYDNLDMIMQRRLSYAIEQLKAVPRVFAEQCYTPWCHPLLYDAEMPAVMRDAQAACALYAMKNDGNARSIWRNIEGRAEQLFRSERPTDPIAMLAHTQAMLLYSIMRLFGGDFAARAKVSASTQQLQDTVFALYATVDLDTEPIPPLAFYPTAESSAFWRTWIVAESQRRTYIAMFMFMSIWSLMNAQLGYCADHAAMLSVWTASAPIWEARNLLDFTRAWQSKRHFLVRNFDLTHLIAEARADDIDQFGKILLSGALGIEELKGWLYIRGGTL